jgi:DNA polymerase III delta subunit
MANWAQWVRWNERGEVRPAYWICGPERRLVEEVVDMVRARVAADPLDQVFLDASAVPAHKVWDAINWYPTGPRGLVLVREADHIAKWEPLLGWLAARDRPQTHVVFVSSAPDTETTLPHIQALMKRGRYVRCGPFSEEKSAVAVLKDHGSITEAAAKLLLQRTNYDISQSLDVLAQCSYFAGRVDERVVRVLASYSPGEFEEALLRFRYGEALEALKEVPPEAYSYIIGKLDRKVDACANIARALKRLPSSMDRGNRTKEVMRATRLEAFVVHELIGIARRYDRKQVRASIEALALADEKVAQGETDLVLETVVALWEARAA